MYTYCIISQLKLGHSGVHIGWEFKKFSLLWTPTAKVLTEQKLQNGAKIKNPKLQCQEVGCFIFLRTPNLLSWKLQIFNHQNQNVIATIKIQQKQSWWCVPNFHWPFNNYLLNYMSFIIYPYEIVLQCSKSKLNLGFMGEVLTNRELWKTISSLSSGLPNVHHKPHLDNCCNDYSVPLSPSHL